MNKFSSSKASEKGAETKNLKQVDLKGSEDSEESVEANSYCSGLGFFQGHQDIAEPGLLLSKYHQEELVLLAHVGALDDLYVDIVSPPFQACGEDIRILTGLKSQNSQLIEPNEEKSYAFPSASLEILKHCRSRVGTVNGKKIHGLSCETKQLSTSPSPLSTNYIIELAAGNFIQSKSGARNEFSAISHPYASTFLGLSTEIAKDIQLVLDVLSCADKVGNQQYDCASKLLEKCNKLSFSKTNTIQRLVYYFTEALHEKIDRETGRFRSMVTKWSVDSVTPSSATITLHKELPPTQVTQFTSIQTIVDHVSACRKVHIIDLEIRCGLQQTILMQALAARSECPLEHFKITAVATNSKLTIEEAGIRLKSLAESLNLNFSFHMIRLEDIINLQRNLFDLDAEEAVVVQAAYALKSMIAKPNQLETLMRVIRNINPRVIIITESEANINSPIFVNRFVEALFFYGALFDCMEDCLKNDVADRTFAESKLFSPAIRNIVAAEGEERKFRIVGINIWREFFARFGMVETELSKLALYHANLVRKSRDCGDSCTLCLNGKCLIIGWKGTPVHSLSAWKLQGCNQ
ncbi:hypothetical protein Pfo_025960 [Paulownia fortunei]|nr:hypothetical protein Pfo_025960 [Paulownia fortunei]